MSVMQCISYLLLLTPVHKRSTATGFLGLFNSLLLLPVLVVLHFTGIASLSGLTWSILGFLVRYIIHHPLHSNASKVLTVWLHARPCMHRF